MKARLLPQDQVRPGRTRGPAVESLENRLLCKITFNGEFAIDPPGGGQGHQTIHMQPEQGLKGLRSAEAHSNGVVNWEITQVHEWTPGDKGGPHGA
jgi:hypothetical protein